MQKERTCAIGSLVLYKKKPAKVLKIDAKIHLDLNTTKTVQVRAKDIILLHLGPIQSLGALSSEVTPLEDLEEVCELLEETTDIEEFAELAYGEYTPKTAWAVYALLEDGLYISGTPWDISIVDPEVRESILKEREKKAQKQADWDAFVSRVRNGTIEPQDQERFFDVENLANGKSPKSRLLKELKIAEDQEHAHALLLKIHIWDEFNDPYPSRMMVSQDIEYPELSIPAEAEAETEAAEKEERIDLTHLAAYAIDDEGSTDPDDAISIDGNRLWIHVADVSSAVSPDSSADLAAREAGANLYLPTGVRTMLHPDASDLFALGLHKESPAFSFGLRLDEDGNITDTQVCLSKVKVTRLTYKEAQQQIGQGDLAQIAVFVERYRDKRRSAGAIELNIPEVKIRLIDGKVSVIPLVAHPSRELVSNSMIMAGEAAARFAIAHEIPFPYTVQMPPEGDIEKAIGIVAENTAGIVAENTAGIVAENTAGIVAKNTAGITEMFKLRRKFKPSALRLSPDVHSGLGVDAYSRVTSPLRRYLDLLAHQQLRAYLKKETLLTTDEILERASIAFEQAKQMQRIERASNKHWKLVYLLQNPQWQGTGIVYDIRKREILLFIEALSMEVSISAATGIELDDELRIQLDSVNLPYGQASFSVVK
jgi:exoribonuclease II